MKLKEENPNLNILLAIGGWNHGSGKWVYIYIYININKNVLYFGMFKINLIFKFKGAFSKMANDDVMRKNFVENSVSFLQKHGFDGLELGFKTKI